MSLPSLSSVLRGIGVGLPGSPPGTKPAGSGRRQQQLQQQQQQQQQQRRRRQQQEPQPQQQQPPQQPPPPPPPPPPPQQQQKSSEIVVPTPAKGRAAPSLQAEPEQALLHQDHHAQPRLLTPVPPQRVTTPTSSSGGYRRRRSELEMMSDELDSPGSALSGCVSDCSGSTATYAGGSGADRSGGGWASSSWDGSDHAWEAGESEHQRHAMAQLTVTPWGGLSAGMGGTGSAYGTSKRARLENSRSISGMSEPANGTRAKGDLPDRGRVTSGASVLEQGYRQNSHSHSTDEWRAMSKAARVLGVDSIEERDVEDQRRASMVKAARMLGVENVEELQQSAARNHRQKWAPPRSSASKAARMLGVEDVSELQREATKARGRSSRRKVLCGAGSKPRQGSISSLIRALEHSEITGAEAQNGGSSDGESRQGGGGGREQQVMETGSAHSVHSNRSSATRATESCSSVSDLTLLSDADGGGGSNGNREDGSSGGARGEGDGGGEGQAQQQQKQQQQQQHQQQKPELSDDQLAGLQTPQTSASTEGGHGRGFSRHSRDEMEIETPPSQPRSAALTSLRQAPAPLLAPYTPSLAAPPYRLSPSPIGSIGPGPSPAGSPSPRQQTPTKPMRHASDFALGVADGDSLRPSPSSSSASAVAEGKGGGASTSVAEEKGLTLSNPLSEAFGDEGNGGGSEGGGGGWSGSGATAVHHRAHQQQQQAAAARLILRASSPVASSAGQEAFLWGSGRLAPPPPPPQPLPQPLAGCKDLQPDRATGKEYKQESPVRSEAGWRRSFAPVMVSEEKQGAWQGQQQQHHHQQQQSPEYKHESDGFAPRNSGGWTPTTPVRPYASIPGGGVAQKQQQQQQHQVHYLQTPPPQHQLPVQTPGRFSFTGRLPAEPGGLAPAVGRGIPLSSAGGSESSVDSESTCDTYPDRLEEHESAPTSAFASLAAMIPVVNTLGMGQHPTAGVKVEESPAAVGVPAAPVVTKVKPRRRQPKGVNSWGDDPTAGSGGGAVPVAHPHPPPVVHAPVMDPAGCGVPGISTRKQQEVATRPREKGRFVKRPPAFLPISAFKRAEEISADAAAEAAEEAREKAVEAAALAAAAAAAAAVQRRDVSGGSMSQTPPSKMSPPAARSGAAPWSTVGGSGGGSNESSGQSFRGYSHDGMSSSGGGGGRELTLKTASRGAPPLSPPSPATTRTGGRHFAPPGSTGGRGRSERRMSPISRAAPNDIWHGDDSSERDHSVSDCGSERGSDDLRGMAFLPWSPMDGPSPLASSWDSPRRGGALSATSGSAASTPARGKMRTSCSSPRPAAGADKNGMLAAGERA